MKRPTAVYLPLLLALILLGLVSSCNPADPPPYIDCDVQVLVDAINDANMDPDLSTIELSPGCTYVVDQPYADPHPIYGNIVTGLPIITTDVTLVGNGATITRPYGSGNTQVYRLFFIDEGAQVIFSDLTISNGHLFVGQSFYPEMGNGGGIYNLGNLDLMNLTFTDNRAHSGGAIASDEEGSLTITDSTFSDNDAYFQGGAIDVMGDGGALVQGCIFDGNTSFVVPMATMGGRAGAISVNSDMEIINSVFMNQETDSGAGVIVTFHLADLLIEGCVFKDNENRRGSSVLYTYDGSVSIVNSTFTGNIGSLSIVPSNVINGSSGSIAISYSTIADNTSNGPAINPESYSLTVANSIISNNNGGDCNPAIPFTVQGNNIDSDGSCQGFTFSGDPLLQPLANNGGGTQTRALDPASPAIDMASGGCPTTDQRGITRPQSFFCDLGAYEAEDVEACSINYLVNAIHFANSDSDPTTIELDPGCTYIVDQQYGDRQSGLPILTTPITILGNGAIITRPDLEDQPDEYRLFYVESRVPVSITDLTLSSGVITGAEGVNDNSDSHGGAIFNRGELSLSGVTIQDNRALYGGALANNARGVITVRDSVFLNNQASFDGGAVYLGGSNGADISGSLFDGNQAVGEGTGGRGGAIFNQYELDLSASSLVANDSTQGGGGVYNIGELEIVGCTLNENAASRAGGSALENQAGTVSLLNSTISGNEAGSGNLSAVFNGGGLVRISYCTITASEGGTAALSGSENRDSYRFDLINSIIAINPSGDCEPGIPIIVYGNNLDSDGSCQGFTHTMDPLLQPLADNGGGTWTHALPINSPALNSASGECPITDQRSVSRPQGPSCDLGAYEYDGIQPTPSPTPELDPCLYEALVNANCRVSDYPESGFITTLAQGETALLIGINPENTHGLFDIADYEPCWILLSLVIGVDAEACDSACYDPPPRPTPSLVCSADLGKEDCLKAGGTYIEVGVPDPFCQCP